LKIKWRSIFEHYLAYATPIFIAKGGSTRQAVLVSGVEAKRAGDTVLPAAPINLSFPPCGGP